MVRILALCLLLSACTTGAIDSYTYLQTMTRTPTGSPGRVVATFPLHVEPIADQGGVESVSPADAPSTWTYRHQGAVTLIQGEVTNQQATWDGLSVRVEGRGGTALAMDNRPLPAGTVAVGARTPVAVAVLNPDRAALDVQIQLVR